MEISPFSPDINVRPAYDPEVVPYEESLHQMAVAVDDLYTGYKAHVLTDGLASRRGDLALAYGNIPGYMESFEAQEAASRARAQESVETAKESLRAAIRNGDTEVLLGVLDYLARHSGESADASEEDKLKAEETLSKLGSLTMSLSAAQTSHELAYEQAPISKNPKYPVTPSGRMGRRKRKAHKAAIDNYHATLTDLENARKVQKSLTGIRNIFRLEEAVNSAKRFKAEAKLSASTNEKDIATAMHLDLVEIYEELRSEFRNGSTPVLEATTNSPEAGGKINLEEFIEKSDDRVVQAIKILTDTQYGDLRMLAHRLGDLNEKELEAVTTSLEEQGILGPEPSPGGVRDVLLSHTDVAKLIKPRMKTINASIREQQRAARSSRQERGGRPATQTAERSAVPASTTRPEVKASVPAKPSPVNMPKKKATGPQSSEPVEPQSVEEPKVEQRRTSLADRLERARTEGVPELMDEAIYSRMRNRISEVYRTVGKDTVMENTEDAANFLRLARKTAANEIAREQLGISKDDKAALRSQEFLSRREKLLALFDERFEEIEEQKRRSLEAAERARDAAQAVADNAAQTAIDS